MTETRKLGASGLNVSALGIGVWSWGDKGYWGYGTTFSKADVQAAYKASLDAGIDFFDTAEIYGGGQSEVLLGECTRTDPRSVLVASKFAPFPFRLSAKAVRPALEASLQRLGRDQLDLYQVHWPYSFIQIEDMMDALADLVKSGKIKAVGVSNYSAAQMRLAHHRLARYGIVLASNQVHYNLLKRTPEINGVLKACRELNVALIAYSPLAQGILTSKNATTKPAAPTGARRFMPQFQYKSELVNSILGTLREVATSREKTLEQVALNWLMSRDELVIPIPGAKTARQAVANAGALGWRLTPEEMARLDKASAVQAI